MNVKAQKYSDFLKANNLYMFKVQGLQHEMNTVVYRTFLEVAGNNLPAMIVIDDSIYVMLEVRVAAGVVKDNNKAAVMDFINKMNGKFKVFKYYVDEEGSIILESCIPATDNEFAPSLVQAVIDVVVRHLNEYNAETMKTILA